MLGIIPVTIEEFSNSKNNAILDASDAQMMGLVINPFETKGQKDKQ